MAKRHEPRHEPRHKVSRRCRYHGLPLTETNRQVYSSSR
jgi:hypothetical protein